MRTIGLLLSLLFLQTYVQVKAQDTIRLMHYNVLYYGKNVYDCNSTNNNRDDKNGYLRTILPYVQPDIITVNEMDADLADIDYLMSQTLNINGVTYWSHAALSGSYSVNMIYYNSSHLKLNSQEVIQGDPAQSDVYHMSFLGSDTIDFDVVVAHLKAGNETSSAELRDQSTQNIMNYASVRDLDNYVVAGDFNVYTSSEACFQNMINYNTSACRLYDPINRLGNWNNNSSFADVHTQSTHTSGECFASGGMDDRFDFILISDAIKQTRNKMSYLSSSYQTIGQDGLHYNSDINAGTNNSAPTAVIDALYNMSDHLPVALDLVLHTQRTPITVFNKTFDDQSLSSGGWQEYSVLDNQRIWNVPTYTYGHNSTYYGAMSGYDYTNSVTVDNQDWLISPSVNLNEMFDEVLSFWSASKYNGNPLELYYSSDYSGSGDPNNATWTLIDGVHYSTDLDFTWEVSGNIDLSQIQGESVYFGFKYTSTPATGSCTWELDDILLLGYASPSGIEIPETHFGMKVYPNPAQNQVQIEAQNKAVGSLKIRIVDMQGRVVWTQESEQTDPGNFEISLDISKLERGFYLLMLENPMQKESVKLVKEY